MINAPNYANGRLVLKSGWDICLDSFEQQLTYGGLLEGLPTIESNRSTVDWLISNELEHRRGVPVVVIEAEETLIEYDGKYPFGTPSRLPMVTCIARFRSGSIGENDPLLESVLTAIWFQESYAMPIAASPLDKLRSLDWEASASNRQV